MPGIARSRRQPGIGSAASRSTRPRGDLGRGAAQRERARGREVERREPRRRGGGDARPAAGASRRPGARAAARRARRSAGAGSRPRARTRSAARVIAAASASHGSGARRDAQLRARRARARPITGRRGRRRGTGAGRRRRRWRSAAAGSPTSRRAPTSRARAEDHAVGARLDDGDVHGLAVAVQQPLQRRRRGGAAARPASRRAARNGHGGATSTRSSCIAVTGRGRVARGGALRTRRHGARADARATLRRARARQSRSRRRCTSTRNEFEPTISPIAPFLRRRAARRPRRRAHDRRRSRRRRRSRSPPARRPARAGTAAPGATGSGTGGGLGRDGQAVDDLALVGVARMSGSVLTQPHSMTGRSDGVQRARCSRRRAEDVVPVGRRDAEAALVVLEVVAHVQLAQPAARRACAAGGGARGSGSCRRPGSRPGSPP